METEAQPEKRLNLHDMVPLKCGVQHYAWGRRMHNGKPPFIADLLGEDPGDKPYAELWIGAHPKLPATVVDGRQEVSLADVIDANPEAILGTALTEQGIEQLPFLLKVLDCEEPLSIQAHPDLTLARTLHDRDPEHYPDSNHKPEIAIAVTEMDAFCQFREAGDVQRDLRGLGPLRSFFKGFLEGHKPATSEWLKAVYTKLFSATHEQVRDLVRATAEAVRAKSARSEQDHWFLRVLQKYPDDRGTLCAYFLNIVHLKTQEAVFLAAKEPHAYLDGTIIECMASSDNVVRAGLTPKFIDTDVLVNMLTYRQGAPNVTTGASDGSNGRIYHVPVPEFQVDVYRDSNETEHVYTSDDAVSLMLVLNGQADIVTGRGVKRAERGTTWLWPAALTTCRIRFNCPDTVVVRARPNMSSLKNAPQDGGD